MSTNNQAVIGRQRQYVLDSDPDPKPFDPEKSFRIRNEFEVKSL
jgi:hypothetical protein